MGRISDIMDPRCIQLSLAARSKEGAVRELVQMLADAGKLDGAGGIDCCVAAVMEREGLSSTGIGRGIAIPHRLAAGVGAIVIAAGRSVRGIPFDSVDGKPAHLIFLIMGPCGENSGYLSILGALSRLLNDREFFETLMRAEGVLEVVELVAERER
ncbi:MAG: PTS sugar transporter subunit IIA [Chitinispirillia bacterium]|nr:PTS sugar transporter subunit IIA [Chitinispirillia bacterium]MCL2241122.1 PTS sugar transporter subunit IIA [Chitinispirillia bacterium]